MFKKPRLALSTSKALQPHHPFRHLHQRMKVITHHRIRQKFHPTKISQPHHHPFECFFLDALKNDLTATSPGHDVVAVALMSSIPHDPASTSRPRAHHPIRPCFRIQPPPVPFRPPSLIPNCRQCFHEFNLSPLSVTACIGCLASFIFPKQKGPRFVNLRPFINCTLVYLSATTRE
jgi:hypothetical protein